MGLAELHHREFLSRLTRIVARAGLSAEAQLVMNEPMELEAQQPGENPQINAEAVCTEPTTLASLKHRLPPRQRRKPSLGEHKKPNQESLASESR